MRPNLWFVHAANLGSTLNEIKADPNIRIKDQNDNILPLVMNTNFFLL